VLEQDYSSLLDHSKASIQTAFFKKNLNGSSRQSMKEPDEIIKEEPNTKKKKKTSPAPGSKEEKKYLQDLMKRHKLSA